MDFSEEDIRDAAKTQELVRKKLLEIMDLQADIDGLLRDKHPTPFGSASKTFTWKGTLPNGDTSTQIHGFIDHDTHEWTFVFRDRKGKALSDMEAKAKRK